MKIRKLESKDIATVVELWYETSIQAHDFISSDYWKANKEAMTKTYLPNSETYLVETENEITGFVAMVDNYLAAIFVKETEQGKGIGQQLLDHVKSLKELIQLKVYKKNTKTFQFYKKNGFTILNESVEKETGEIEFFMEWTK